ncbi:hypothetical protein D9V29_11030 [Mycetocola manganoxydans]|uniref:DUF5671 domain-containing protein n=1 Tax=Mycetocola manganoxydans TaxID=699879 RepID=A0A3L6ZQ12_9MICO|nr:DUF5671 domain-containing protein [Mycetocola manganoxydans]RLP69755.1 hypothetical protein D9V29_11030 [Mycetocola manganoxydans]GHD49909.1 hypothetical protein GCM10008097_23160 [Mycetocola manganoxydans]
MTVSAPYEPATGSSAGQTIRRVIVYSLLFALVIIAATGLQGLLALVLEPDTVIAGESTGALAQSLAFTLIGGPLATLLWWASWRRLSEPAERAALTWGLYISLASVVAVITATVSLVGVVAALIDGEWDGSACATAVVFAAVWVWHRWMWRHPAKSPLRLAEVPAVLGAAFGILLGAGSAIATLAGIFDAAIIDLTAAPTIGERWWVGTFQTLVWAAGGLLVWAWHWYREGARTTTTGLANVALILIGILLAALATLGGVGTVLYVVLRLLLDSTDPIRVLLSPLGVAIAAALIGAVIWTYSRGVALGRTPAVRQASILATSGIGLVGAASGLGIVVNSALGIFATRLAGDDLRSLLLGGLSALLVGGVVWWFTWRPFRPTDAAAAGTGRRIYLIAVFGLSAIVALITLLVIGYRLFEFFLQGGGNLIEQIRAPLGLLTATALVAGYHFGVWRHDRADAAASAPAERLRTIGEVILVTAANASPLVDVIRDRTGATVTVWPTASAVQLDAASPAVAEPSPDPESLARALDGVTGRRVLVLAGPAMRLEVVPLAD